MRPPQNAGENEFDLRLGVDELAHASMRPPQNAGENTRAMATTTKTAHGFNEAPAKRGGKLGLHAGCECVHVASMRPRKTRGKT